VTGLRIMAATAIALAGIAVGHAVVYAAVTPAHPETSALVAAGHTHWPSPWQALPVATLLAIIAVGIARHRAFRLRRLFPVLTLLQSTGFLALEAAERLLLLDAVSSLVTEPMILVGLGVQVVVAAALTAVFGVGQRIAARLAGPQRHGRAHRPVVACAVPPTVRIRRHLLPGRGGLSFRGPPATV
jgi:hypothetical protein